MEIVLEKPRRPRAGRWAVNALCLLVMVLALAFLLPAAFGLQRYVITGGSMDGTIDLGSVVFEEVVPVADLEVGDVITYQSRPPTPGSTPWSRTGSSRSTATPSRPRATPSPTPTRGPSS